VGRVKAALLAFVWALIIYFGKSRLLESLESLTLIPSITLIIVLAAFCYSLFHSIDVYTL